MLYSELNRINLNVLIQDSEYEAVPDISSCYVHNAIDWTIWHKELEQTEEPEEIVEDYDNGWEISSFVSDDLEDAYLNYALTDISSNVKVMTEYDSDIVKIYAGQFEVDGTINYDCFVEADAPFQYRDAPPPPPYRGSWWTFNNGAFQWIGGWPKSIPECRFSYGPFCGPGCPDPHHHDNNHEMLDRVLTLSVIQNLVFVFDPQHVLKGIISLPSINEDVRTITKDYIGKLIDFAKQNYYKLSFKNMDEVLREFSKVHAFLPSIKVAHKKPKEMPERPVNAVFEISEKAILTPPCTKYILPDTSTLRTFIERSNWKTYSVNRSFDIGIPEPFKPEPLVPSDDISAIMDHVNALQDVASEIYNSYNNRYTIYTKLTEGYLAKAKDKTKSTAIMTLSDLFRNTKEIDKVYDKDKNFIIVLPQPFCNKETLQMLTNVKYQ